MIKTQPKILRRAAAAFIDIAVCIVYFYLFLFTFGEPNEDGGYSSNGPEAILLPLFWILYFPVLESTIGRTLGKKLLGLKVVSINGNKITFWQALKRRLLDIIELFHFGIVAMIVVSKTTHHQRLGDLWAGALVVGGESAMCNYCGEEFELTSEEVVSCQFKCPECNEINGFWK